MIRGLPGVYAEFSVSGTRRWRVAQSNTADSAIDDSQRFFTSDGKLSQSKWRTALSDR